MKRRRTWVMGCLACLAIAIGAAMPIAGQAADPPGEGIEYIVQPGDWLTKIAIAYYGDPDAYRDIVEATNAKAAEDASFAVIRNANYLEVGQKLWLPRQPGMAPKVTPSHAKEDPFVDRLVDTAYPSGFTKGGIAPLTGGEYREAAAPGSATETVVQLERYARGDLNGDGVDDAAVILVTDPGGSGIFRDVVAVLNRDGMPAPAASALLGDRVKLLSLDIVDGEIIVGMYCHGPEDPLCCPTQQVTRTYALQLALVSEVEAPEQAAPKSE